MASAPQTALPGCVSSLRASMQLLDSSIAILDAGVRDFPRLAKVLHTTRHYELVSSAALLAAQTNLLADLAPEVAALLSRVETHLDRLARREQSLTARAELQAGRLEQQPGSAAARESKSPARVGAPLQGLKMLQLRQKRERLSYAVGRLEMQAGQRERQLRKSMAFQ